MNTCPKNIALFTLLFGSLLASCEIPKNIVQSLTEQEANEILVVLDSQKIPASKIEVPGREITFSISVNEAKASAALKLLVNNQLPRQRQRGFAQVYPQGKGGLIPSKNEEKARFLMGSQGEIENMLEILPGVVKAKVAIVVPDSSVIRDLNSPPPRATASVALIYNPAKPGQPLAVSLNDIQKLVASAVEDLKPEDVTILVTANQPLTLIGIAAATSPRVKTIEAAPTTALDQLEKSTNASMAPELKRALAVYLKNQSDESAKAQSLIWLFAALALAGIGIGVFGLRRASRSR